MAQAHQAYRTAAIETASPEQLTLMCYDGALRFIRRAINATQAGDRGRVSEATGRAQAVINELNVTLNMEAGGEISSNLRQIYLFVNRHLSTAITEQSEQPLQDSLRLVQGLRDAWAEAMQLGAVAA